MHTCVSSSTTPISLKYHIIDNPIKKPRKKITPALIAQYFGCSQPEAAKRLGISVSTLKRLFYQFHPMKRWPYSDTKRAQKAQQAINLLVNTDRPENRRKSQDSPIAEVTRTSQIRKLSLEYIVNDQKACSDERFIDNMTLNVLNHAFSNSINIRTVREDSS